MSARLSYNLRVSGLDLPMGRAEGFNWRNLEGLSNIRRVWGV